MKLSTKSGRDGKVHIYIDDEYKLTVDGDYWYTSSWYLKKQIDDDEFEELTDEITKRRAFNNAVSLAMTRLHSKGELFQKLSKKYTKEAAEYAAEKCEEIGVINDTDFAYMYADELRGRKHFGVSRIKQELRRKGISSDIIEQVIDETEIDNAEQIKELIERKYYRSLSDEKGMRRTVAALTRLGYSYYDIRRALEEYDISCEEAEEVYDE